MSQNEKQRHALEMAHRVSKGEPAALREHMSNYVYAVDDVHCEILHQLSELRKRVEEGERARAGRDVLTDASLGLEHSPEPPILLNHKYSQPEAYEIIGRLPPESLIVYEWPGYSEELIVLADHTLASHDDWRRGYRANGAKGNVNPLTVLRIGPAQPAKPEAPTQSEEERAREWAERMVYAFGDGGIAWLSMPPGSPRGEGANCINFTSDKSVAKQATRHAREACAKWLLAFAASRTTPSVGAEEIERWCKRLRTDASVETTDRIIADMMQAAARLRGKA